MNNIHVFSGFLLYQCFINYENVTKYQQLKSRQILKNSEFDKKICDIIKKQNDLEHMLNKHQKKCTFEINENFDVVQKINERKELCEKNMPQELSNEERDEILEKAYKSAIKNGYFDSNEQIGQKTKNDE